MSFDDALLKALNHSTTHHAFDGYILPGFRVWQLCAILKPAILRLFTVVVVCCFSRVRIPRTKRQIELSAAKRKMRKKHIEQKQQNLQSYPQGIFYFVLAFLFFLYTGSRLTT
ncbi:unnamed protein product [Enterobius vermicularis]|uniref:Transmembrane protein n=1 Tax=Enterobius vermicularis TaxID=51028 RepID=A0A0N4UWV3_ENTVE|nr:unnamed protein product [Enterobius vermicularis]